MYCIYSWFYLREESILFLYYPTANKYFFLPDISRYLI